MLGALNSRHLLLTGLEAGKSKIKVSADSFSDDSPFLACRLGDFSLCPHMAERAESPGVFLHKDTNPIMGAPPP